eukprot:392370-Prymnesium_polylepis.2
MESSGSSRTTRRRGDGKLLGKRLKVLWRYWEPLEGGERKADDYNHTMHFVDDKDRLAYYYRPNAGWWHGNKYTAPVYLWSLKTKVDQAFALYKIREREKVSALTESGGKAAVAEWKKANHTWSHYDFIVRVIEWKVMEGYNYGLPPARCIVPARSALDSPPMGTQESQKRKRGLNQGEGAR